MRTDSIKFQRSVILLVASLSLAIFPVFGCKDKSEISEQSQTWITDTKLQVSIFNDLIKLTNGAIKDDALSDSLAFLVLPIQASCPSCRKKTIDSIAKHQNSLADRHFIIISASGSRRKISSYFQEQEKSIPVIENRLFLDTANKAKDFGLYDEKPTIYYTYDQKTYKKVSAIPATVRQDLQEFFSGFRDDHSNE
jgi:hypothetical protein